MKTRTRVATTLVAAVAAVSMAAPAPASAAVCYDKYTQRTCQELSNLVCYLFERCF